VSGRGAVDSRADKKGGKLSLASKGGRKFQDEDEGVSHFNPKEVDEKTVGIARMRKA